MRPATADVAINLVSKGKQGEGTGAKATALKTANGKYYVNGIYI